MLLVRVVGGYIYILCPEISVNEYNVIVGKLSLLDCPIMRVFLPQATFVFVELEVKRIIARSRSTWQHLLHDNPFWVLDE